MNNNGIFIGNFNIIQELILGGESKYGFGHVLFDSINKIDILIKWNNPDKIKIDRKESIITNLKYNKKIKFQGNVELLSGRGYYDPKNSGKSSDKSGQIISKPEYYFSPGTVLIDEINVMLDWDGTLKVINEKLI